jgi:hypothetical protein
MCCMRLDQDPVLLRKFLGMTAQSGTPTSGCALASAGAGFARQERMWTLEGSS